MRSSQRVSRLAALLVAVVCLVAGVPLASASPASDPADLLRIRGGEIAPDGAHPYAAQLDISSGPNYVGRCTGALIGARWIATAAHCVSDFRTPGSPVLADLTIGVVLGTPAVGPDAAPPLRASSTYAIKHPGFDLRGRGLNDDFALVRLDAPVDAPALGLLSEAEAPVLAPPGTVAETIGWGIEGPGGTRAQQLRQTTMPLIDDATCDTLDPFNHFDGANMVCAGFTAPETDVSGTCAGDSGGPLMVRDAADRPRLLGVTSWGFDPSCASGPDVFSEVPVVAAPVLAAARTDALAPLAEPAVTARALTTAADATIALDANAGNLATRYSVTYSGDGQTGEIQGDLPAGTQSATSVTLDGLTSATQYAVTVTVVNALGAATEELVVSTQ